MSDFPPGYSDMPPGPGGPRDPGAPYGGAPLPPPGSDLEAIRGRVRPPAIFLLVVNALNVLAGGYLLLNAFTIKSNPAAAEAMVDQQWSTMTPDQLKQVHETLGSTHDFITTIGNVTLWEGGLSVVIGVLGILGGIRMLSLRSFGLGATASILTAIPCVTPCCLLGQAAGIWALIVLLQSDVRSAFR